MRTNYLSTVKTVIWYILLSVVLIPIACSSEEGDLPSSVEPTNIRLKYLTTTQEMVGALGTYAEGWTARELQIERNINTYPGVVWLFEASLDVIKGTDSQHAFRAVTVLTDGPIELEEMEEIERQKGAVRIHDPQLTEYPSLYVFKDSENSDSHWTYSMYAHQVDKNGNRTTHIIYMRGGYTLHSEAKPSQPTDKEVVKAMFDLLEEHD